jgi:hypothetical protein
MASTYKLNDGDAIIVAAGPPADVSDGISSPRTMRLETFGHNLNGGTVVFLDVEARAWLREKLEEWDRDLDIDESGFPPLRPGRLR